MLRWSEFAAQRPDLAEAGRAMLYFFGPGLGMLATVRRDGGPRVHPVCPCLHDGALYVFVGPTPKLRDLLRDGRYALHSNPLPDNDDACYVTGDAVQQFDVSLRRAVEQTYFAGLGRDEPWPGFEDEVLFELTLDTVLITRTPGHGGPYQHEVWKMPA